MLNKNKDKDGDDDLEEVKKVSIDFSKKGKGKKRSEAALKLLKALAWSTQDSREYCSSGVSAFLSNGGEISDLVKVARTHRDDPVVSKLLTFLKSVFMGGN